MFKKLSYVLTAGFAILAAACAPEFAHAQIINPNPPQVAASAVAGTGLTQAGAVLSVNYGLTAGTAMQGNNTAFTTVTASGNVTSTKAITASTNVAPFGMGALTWNDTNIFGSWQTSANSFAQMVLQNSSNGAAASTGYIVSNDVGTATTFYGEFGINSSGFTGTGSFNLPSATYLTSTSGDLAIGTTTANAIHFVVNNGSTDAMAIASTGAISTNQPVTVGSTLTATGTISGASLNVGTGQVAAGYTAPLTGAVNRVLYSKLNDIISVLDFGADPTGVAAADTAFNAWATACAGKICVIPGGSYLLNTGNINISSGSTVEFYGGATINYTGTGAVFRLFNVKDVTFQKPNITVTGVGAHGIELGGAWFTNIYAPSISGNSTSNGQTAINMLSSNITSLGWGNYMTNIYNPDFTHGAMQYGINANKYTSTQTGTTTAGSAIITGLTSTAGFIAGMPATGANLPVGVTVASINSATQVTLNTGVGVLAGTASIVFADTVANTHLAVYGGWSTGYPTPLNFQNLSTFYIRGFTPEQGVDGIDIGPGCNGGMLEMGEMSNNTGWGINITSAAVSGISVILPSVAGNGGTLGLINTANYTPTQYLSNGITILGSAGVSNYKYSAFSQFNYGQSYIETIQGGGPARVTRTYGDAAGVQEMYVSGISGTTTPANNLRGTVTVAASSSTATFTFPNSEPDANYIIELTPTAFTGTQATNSNRVKSVSKSAGSFTVTTEAATAAANTQVFDWVLVR